MINKFIKYSRLNDLEYAFECIISLEIKNIDEKFIEEIKIF